MSSPVDPNAFIFGGQQYPASILSPEGTPLFFNPYRGTYTASRPYAQRMQRGFLRGIGSTEARRGGGVTSGAVEAERRRAFIAEYGSMQQFEETYGFSYRYWLTLRRRYLDEINSMTHPSGWITPDMVADEFANSPVFSQMLGMLGPQEWIERRLGEKLQDMILYREGDSISGFFHYQERDYYRPVEWWWYH